MPVTLPTGMGGPVGHARVSQEPVSHTAVSKLHPVLGEFLDRRDCKHWPIQNVCLGSGGKEQTYPLVFPALCMKSSRR